MVLTEEEYNRYLNVHLRILYYCYRKKNRTGEVLTIEKFINKPIAIKFEARNYYIEHPGLIHSFIKENKQLSAFDKDILLGFKLKISGKFIILKQLKKYAIFINITSEKFYAVLALSDPFQNMLDHFPVLIETTILPYNGKIIYDGFLTREIYIGKNIKDNLQHQYKVAKANNAIIKTIEQ